jgi:hypothetical protein
MLDVTWCKFFKFANFKRMFRVVAIEGAPHRGGEEDALAVGTRGELGGYTLETPLRS